MLNPLSFITKIFKSSNQNEIDKIQYLLKKVNNLEKEISSLEDKDFPKKTAELKSKLTTVLCPSTTSPPTKSFELLLKTDIVWSFNISTSC